MEAQVALTYYATGVNLAGQQPQIFGCIRPCRIEAALGIEHFVINGVVERNQLPLFGEEKKPVAYNIGNVERVAPGPYIAIAFCSKR